MKALSILTTLVFVLGRVSVTFAADCDVPSASTQDSNDITVTELYPAPATGEDEFIELYNSGSSGVNLASWLLSDESGKQYVIPDGTMLNAGQYLVLYQATTGITLNNTGDVITLFNSAGEARSSTEYGSAASQASWSLNGDTWEWTVATPGQANADSVDGENAEEDSAGSESGTSSASDETSPDIFLNELLPNPAGLDTTDEWIEVVNEGSESISLHNWQLTDQTTYYTIGDVSIGAGEYIIFEVGDTHISLNNTGDTVYLIDPFGSIINGTEYSSSTEGSVWARNTDTWEWSTTATPGEANVFAGTAASAGVGDADTSDTSEEASADVESITAFRSLEDGQSATIEGVVTVLPNVFGSQYFYIQDNTGGIQVYSYSKAFPELQLGDRIRVTGEKSTSRNEARIKTAEESNIVVIGHGEDVEATDISVLDEAHEGMLVHIQGEVIDRSGSTVTIDDSIAVILKSGTGITASTFAVGTSMSVVGIVGQYDDSYRVMPRSSEDVSTVQADESAWIQPAQAASAATTSTTSAATKNSPQQSWTVIVLLVIAGIVLAARYFLWHRKQKALEPLELPQDANRIDL